MTLAVDATETIAVVDPETGRELATIPAGSAELASAAVDRAARAFDAWSARPATERASLLQAGARRLRHHAEELARLQSSEGGKPLDDSRGGVEAGIGTLEQFAALGPLRRGRALLGDPAATDVMIPEPYGVAACLTPWNDPVAIVCQAIAACLVTGNTVVLKPSERTPLTAVRIADLLELPEGVLEVALGDARTGRPLVADPRVALVYHVGSASTGREIAEVCGRHMKKAVLELGGNDPLVVDDDVDPVWAAEQAATGAFANAGQICVAVERIYVVGALHDAFVDALVDAARRTVIGPLVDDVQRRAVHEQVEEAVAAGARCMTGGAVPGGPGFHYPPTVLTGCHPSMVVMREETFGPVAPVMAVASFDEAIAHANDSRYGLAATVLTGSHEHAQRAARALRCGTVKVNAVFGGAPGGAAHPRGASGQGFGYGPELLDEVTQTKVVHLRPAPGGRTGQAKTR